MAVVGAPVSRNDAASSAATGATMFPLSSLVGLSCPASRLGCGAAAARWESTSSPCLRSALLRPLPSCRCKAGLGAA